MTTVGFDFGTTNTLISIVDNGKLVTFLDQEDQQPFPSVVSYQGERRIVGKEAKRNLSGAGLGVQGNTIKSPKMFLGREGVFLDGVERSPIDVVADVVEYVRDQALRSPIGKRLGRIESAVVTIPVNMEGYRRAALRDAFAKAGIRIVQFIHEPLAALYGFFRSQTDSAEWLRNYDRRYILVFDWGGGTLDLTVCRLSEGMLAQRANDGTEEVGGDVFDDQIRNEVIARVISARGLPSDVLIGQDARSRLLESCERAKIDLSSRESAQIFVPEFFQGVRNPEFAFELSRSELQVVCADVLDKGFARIEQILQSANVSRREIALCLATGGMSNMPAVKERLHEWFGPQRVYISERSATLISEGAAWMAFDERRLHLAKNVELLLSRGVHYRLVDAGVRMPLEKEMYQDSFHFYCADPTDGKAKFVFETPERPGQSVLNHEPRRPLGIATVKVDSLARPLRERLELDLSLDENLVLKAQARSLNKGDMAEVEIHVGSPGTELEFAL